MPDFDAKVKLKIDSSQIDAIERKFDKWAKGVEVNLKSNANSESGSSGGGNKRGGSSSNVMADFRRNLVLQNQAALNAEKSRTDEANKYWVKEQRKIASEISKLKKSMDEDSIKSAEKLEIQSAQSLATKRNKMLTDAYDSAVKEKYIAEKNLLKEEEKAYASSNKNALAGAKKRIDAITELQVKAEREQNREAKSLYQKRIRDEILSYGQYVKANKKSLSDKDRADLSSYYSTQKKDKLGAVAFEQNLNRIKQEANLIQQEQKSLLASEKEANKQRLSNNSDYIKQAQKLQTDASKKTVSTKEADLSYEKSLIKQAEQYRLKAAKTEDTELKRYYGSKYDEYKNQYIQSATGRLSASVKNKDGSFTQNDARNIRNYYKEQEKATSDAIQEYQTESYSKQLSQTTKEAKSQYKQLTKESESYRLKAAKTTDKNLKKFYTEQAEEYSKQAGVVNRILSDNAGVGDTSNYIKYQMGLKSGYDVDRQIEEYNLQQQAKENAAINKQNYSEIVKQQKRVNQLTYEREKYASGSAKYDSYTEAIQREQETYDSMISDYGELSKIQNLKLDSLKAENDYRIENFKLQNQADKYDKRIAQYNLKARWKDNSKIVANYGDEVKAIDEAMEKASTYTEINEVNKRANALYSQAKAEGNDGLTTLDKFKNSFKGLGIQIAGVMAQFLSIRTAIQLGKQMLDNVIKIDTAMTELRKVTNNSEKEYADYQNQVKKTAYEIGSTQADLITSTATFARLGYNLSDSAKLGRNAALYASVGDEGMTADDAATYMVSIMKGFSIAAEDSKHIVDSMNEVGNNFSISSTGLGESLQRSGAALSTGQNSFEEAIGLTVAANDATQDATATGTALKTISLRLRGAKTELEEAGEDTEGMATSTAKLRESLIALSGVDILKNGNTFKSTFQIMRELSNVWDDLSDMNQAAIIEQVAGKRGASFFSSMMRNWEDAENAYKTAINSEGSAEKENENILNSIEGRITRLKSSFESLSTDVISTDLVKGLVTGTDKAIQGLDKVVGFSKGNLLKEILGFGGGALAISAGAAIKKGLKNFSKDVGMGLLESIATSGFEATSKDAGKFIGEELGKSSAVSFGKIFASHPALTGIAATIGIASAAYALWDKNTEQYAETQQKVANNLQNYNSAMTQTKTIQEEIASNEKTIAELEASDSRTTAINAQISALKEQNSLLKLQKEYQESIAETSQRGAALEVQKALANQNSYLLNGETTSDGKGKFLSFLMGVGDWLQPAMKAYSDAELRRLGQSEFITEEAPKSITDTYTKSATQAFEDAIVEYKNAKKELLSVDASDQQAYTEANSKYLESLATVQGFMSDYQDYASALVDSNGNIVNGFDDTYSEVRRTLNKANYAINGKESFAKSLLAQFDGAEEAFEEQARKGGLSVEYIRENFDKLGEAADDVGLSLYYVVDAFNNAAQGGNTFLNLTSDKLETVNSRMLELEEIINNVASASTEAFGVSGLSRSAYNTLGESYQSAMMFTSGSGVRLNYAEYQKQRGNYSSVQQSNIASEIKTEQGLIKDYQIALEKQKRILEENQAIVDYIGDGGGTSQNMELFGNAIDNIAKAKENIKNLSDYIAISESNIKNYKVARAEIRGLTSDVAQYISTVEGAYSQTQTVDTIAGSFKTLFDEFDAGKTSTAQIREFIELYTGKDLSGVSNADVDDYWEGAKEGFLLFNNEIKDADDNVTGYEFDATKSFEAIKNAGEELNKAFVDTNGNIKLTSSDILTLANKFGVSEDAIEAAALALADFGHDVDITDTTSAIDTFIHGNKKVSFKKYGINGETSKNNYGNYLRSKKVSRSYGAEDYQSQYGNIDLTNREQLVNEDGSISTVLGSWGEYGENGEIKIAFTPLLQTGTGTPQELTQESINNYINTLIEKANEDGKIEEGELLKLDAEGIEQDGQVIKNIIADVGDTAEVTAQQMHAMEEVRLAKELQDKHIEELQAARLEAGKNGNTEDLEALNNRMVSALVYRERMGRSYETDDLMHMDASELSGNVQTVTTYLQQLQTAKENLAAATTARETYGIDIDVDSLAGDVEIAEDAIAEYIQSVVQLGEVDLSDFNIDASSTLDDITEQLEGVDLGALFESLGFEIDLGQVEVINYEAVAQKIKDGFDAAVGSLDSQFGVGNYQLSLDANGNITSVTVDPSLVPTVDAQANVDTSDAQNAVDSVDGKQVEIDADASGAVSASNEAKTAIENVPPFRDTRFVGLDVGLTHLANYALSYPEHQTKYVDIVVRQTTTAGSNGTAHYSGSAYANGSSSWGAVGGTALVGEVEPELMVYNNRWQIIGKNGAEMRNIPKGAIIFNGRQTRDIFAHGYTNYGGGRGRIAHYNGTAYADGTDFDFIETYLSRASRKTDKLQNAVDMRDNMLYQYYHLQALMKGVTEEINANNKAYSAYMAKANSVGLSSDYAEKVRNGSLDISTITDENLSKKISLYKEYYEAALDCKDTILELTTKERELWRENLESIQNSSDAYQEWRQSLIDMYEARNNLAVERNGSNSIGNLKKEGKSYEYIIRRLRKEYNMLTKEFETQAKAGIIEPHTTRWREAKQAINDVKKEIAETALAIEELNNSIRETNWQKYENAISSIEAIDNELSTLYSVVGNINAFTSDGKISKAGKTQLGLLASSLGNTRQKIADYNVALKALDVEYQKGVINQQEYTEQVQEIRQSQLSAMSSADSYRQSIIKLVEDGINKETEAMKKLINSRKEALSKQKEADSYAKTVSDKTKKINEIQAQIAAMSGDTTLATQAKVKALQASLKEAQDSLVETQKDRQYTVVTEALDDEMEQFEELQNTKIEELNSSLTAQNEAIKNALELVKSDYNAIYGQLKDISNEYGVQLSADVVDPWKEAKNAVAEYTSAIKKAKADTSIRTTNYLDSASASATTSTTASTKTSTTKKKTTKSSKSNKSSSSGQIANGTVYKASSNGVYMYNTPNGSAIRGFNAGNLFETDGKQQSGWLHIHVKNATEDRWGWIKMTNVKKAAGGARNIGGLTLTNEEGLGSEAIITKAGALMQLNSGSTVFSKDQTELLWRLSKMPLSTIASGAIVGGSSLGNAKSGDVNINYGSLLTVNGDVSKDTLPDLEEILKRASEKTRKDIFEIMRKQGISR